MCLEYGQDGAVLHQHQHIVVDVVVCDLREYIEELLLQLAILGAEHHCGSDRREAQLEFIACGILAEQAIAGCLTTYVVIFEDKVETASGIIKDMISQDAEAPISDSESELLAIFVVHYFCNNENLADGTAVTASDIEAFLGIN